MATSQVSRLCNRQKLGYGMGHILNDLCASMWFTYLLIFFHDVLNFSQSTAGYILLIGQVADGLSTTFVGYESDHQNCCCRYGKRKSWHLLGTICVVFSFPFLFNNCVGCTSESSELSRFIYYAPLVVIFQFGWASTQISHLSLIPDLSPCADDQIFLNSLRYAMTVASSVLVYLLAWIFFKSQSSSSSGGSQHITPADAPAFRNLVLTVVGCGAFFSLLFHLLLREKPHHVVVVSDNDGDDDYDAETEALGDQPSLQPDQTDLPSPCQLEWYDWFKNPNFYLNGLTYMSTRLVVNLSQVYLPMYLQYALNLGRSFIAIIPLIAFVAGFFGAILVRLLSKVFIPEVLYFFGASLVGGACVWAGLLDGSNSQFYGMAVLLGMGSSIMLIISLSMTSRMIGDNKQTTAFVYGVMSLLDKLSNGIGVSLLQNLNPCACLCALCGIFYQKIMSYVVGGITVAGFASVLLTLVVKRSSVRSGYEPI